MSADTTQDSGGRVISAREYAELSVIAKKTIGLDLGDSRKSMVQRRLAPRLKRLGLSSFEQYIEFLNKSAEERESLTSSLTTNVTQFFREDYHFDHLTQKVLPDLSARLKAGERARIWSCASSSGEEPYSIAMTVVESIPDAQSYDFRILATDIDQDILKRARDGLYEVEHCKGLSPERRKRHFLSPAGRVGEIQANPNLKSMIDFARLNLLQEWPFQGKFDVIFCRNVAIYFDEPTQDRLWQRLTDRLAANGVLCIGHSESIPMSVQSRLRKVATKTFQKA